MIITKRTKTKDVLPFINKENIDYILENVPEVELKKSIMNMTIEEFSEIILNEEAFILAFLKEKRAFKAFGKLKSYRKQMDDIQKFMKLYDIKQTNEEKQAANGIIFPDMVSRMLITVTKFFSLKSFDEAKKVKISDFLMIFQDENSSIQYQRAYSDILKAQQKIKNKGKK